MSRFNKKTVLVTGGTRGLGAGITKAFLKEGANVIANFASNWEAANKFRESVSEYQSQLQLKCFDIANAKAVEQFFAELDEQSVVPDVLVNNAGIRRDSILGMLPESDWDAVLETNLKGGFLMSKFAVARMSRKRWGRVLFISSPSGQMGFAGQGNYSASKAGQIGLMKALSKEVAKRKITVNCIAPGFIATDLISDIKDEMRERYKEMIALKRFGTVEEVAETVLFLASDQASYVTGTVLNVDGGLA